MSLLSTVLPVLLIIMAVWGGTRIVRKRKWVIGITDDRCSGCGKCAGRCRHGVIEIEKTEDGKRHAVVRNAQHCTACGKCIRQCSRNAMKLRNRAESTATGIITTIFTLTAGVAANAQPATIESSSDSLSVTGSSRETVHDSLMLGTVTVRGRQVIVKNDRRLFIPTARLRETSTDGIDLLRRMRLPRIHINAMTGEIGASGGGTVILCINGVQATSAELAAVPVENIVRIEHHDNPGARYGGATAVIDYITRHKERGGSISGDMLDTFGNGMAAINSFSARQNSGKSEWSMLVSQMQIKRSRWFRDYEEERVTPDGTIQRHEPGEPVHINVGSYTAQLNYSVTDEGEYFFNARLGYTFDNTPQSEEADRQNILYTSQTEVPTVISEHMDEQSRSPALDLYLQKMLHGGGSIIINAVGTYIGTRSTRTYQEKNGDILATDVLSRVKGRKYSLITEALMEKPFSTHKLTFGIRHTQAYTNNDYTGNSTATVNMRQAESSLYGEYSRNAGKWSYMANVTVSRLYYSQGDEHTDKTVLEPSANMQFAPSANSYLRYKASLRTQTPQLADMNGIEQIVDRQQIRRGNPSLSSFDVMEQNLMAGYNGTWLSADLTLGYKYEHHPIMEQTTFEDGLFVSTDCNQRAFHTLSAEATVTFRPWKGILNISFTPSVNRYISHGNSYTHTCTMPRLRCEADLTLGRWMISYSTLTGYANYLYGERLMEENAMHLFTVGHRWRNITLQAGVLNPFMKEYWMKTCDMTGIMPSVSRAYTDRPCQFAMKVTFHIAHGRQKQETERMVQHEDKETGIMQAVRGK